MEVDGLQKKIIIAVVTVLPKLTALGIAVGQPYWIYAGNVIII